MTIEEDEPVLSYKVRVLCWYVAHVEGVFYNFTGMLYTIDPVADLTAEFARDRASCSFSIFNSAYE